MTTYTTIKLNGKPLNNILLSYLNSQSTIESFHRIMRIFIPKKFLSAEDTKLEHIQDLKFYLDGSKFF